ncbi:MAG: hypothetical protein AAGD25_21940 [Cyanobacteria bacterium P01_F01_bin.150]
MNERLNILIAEDESKTLEDLEYHVKRIGTENKDDTKFFLAKTIDEAFNVIKRNRIDAIFLDYRFGDESKGDRATYYASRLISKLSNFIQHEIYVVLISGYDDESKFNSLRQSIRDLGFRYEYQKKPISVGEITSVYSNIVDSLLPERPLPSFLAVHDAQFKNASLAEKLFGAKDFIEAVVKYASIILAADLSRNKVGTIEDKWNVNTSYTFGGWLRLLKTLSKHEKLADKDCFMPELDSFLHEKLDFSSSKEFNDGEYQDLSTLLKTGGFGSSSYPNSVEVVEFIEKIKLIRDKLLGHSPTTPDPSSRERIFCGIEPLFDQFQKCIRFLSKYPLLVINELEIDFEKTIKGEENYESRRDWYTYNVGVLMGSSASPSVKRSFYSQERLTRGNLYLSNGSGKFLCLYPFMVYEGSRSSVSNKEIFCFDNVEGGKASYRAPSGNFLLKDIEDLKRSFSEVVIKT